MKLIFPSFCEQFACKASDCSDNCCIGWEIDIDADSLAYYNSVSGPLGEKLRREIDCTDTPHFRLDEKERCPFLQADNLCEIICSLGKEHLCNICRDHPRYYAWFGTRKEGGIGLCCEAAAELILTQPLPMTFIETEIPDEQCDSPDAGLLALLTDTREEMFALLADTNIPLTEAFGRLLDAAELLEQNPVFQPIPQTEYPYAPPMRELLEELLAQEAMDSAWHPYLQSILPYTESCSPFPIEADGYLRRIASYFLQRYLLKAAFDGELYDRILFAAESTAVIGFCYSAELQKHGILPFQTAVQIAKNYSKEVEYDT